MNLYVRYFNNERVVKSVDEAVAFLQGIEEIKLGPNVASRIHTFLNSSNLYPFRLKVSYSNYVLFLKTELETLEEFKEAEAARKAQSGGVDNASDRKQQMLDALNEEHDGWWDATLTFKRVVTMPETGKCKYIDTRFRAKTRAISAMDAYNRMVDHLRGRADVDPRSQYPSAKSEKYEYEFLGASL